MKILCHVHGYPPTHNAGAEWMLHHILQFLVNEKGWEATVAIPDPDKKIKEYWGVQVIPEYQRVHIRDYYREADLILTHLDKTGKAINNARILGKPLVHLVHNTHHNGMLANIQHNAWVVYNSNYTSKALHYKHPSMICYPPVPVKEYETKRGGGRYVTLINLWPPKGGRRLYHIAEALPEVPFLGIRGGYGAQLEREQPNVEIRDNTPEIQKIYNVTKILIMPGEYESFGRVGVEAFCSGIPVIAHPTPGVKESLGDAGIFIDRNDTKAWVKKIQELLESPEAYKKASTKAKARAKALEEITLAQLEDLHEFLHKAVKTRGLRK